MPCHATQPYSFLPTPSYLLVRINASKQASKQATWRWRERRQSSNDDPCTAPATPSSPTRAVHAFGTHTTQRLPRAAVGARERERA